MRNEFLGALGTRTRLACTRLTHFVGGRKAVEIKIVSYNRQSILVTRRAAIRSMTIRQHHQHFA